MQGLLGRGELFEIGRDDGGFFAQHALCRVLRIGIFFGVHIAAGQRQHQPVELEHAALLDGANRAQALWYVVMPLALPGIIATAIFTFIVAWNDFLFALVLIGKDELKTLAIGINEFFHMAVVDWGLIMAAGVMVTIPALLFFVAIQRYLIAGWGAGGLKG